MINIVPGDVINVTANYQLHGDHYNLKSHHIVIGTLHKDCNVIVVAVKDTSVGSSEKTRDALVTDGTSIGWMWGLCIFINHNKAYFVHKQQ